MSGPANRYALAGAMLSLADVAAIAGMPVPEMQARLAAEGVDPGDDAAPVIRRAIAENTDAAVDLFTTYGHAVARELLVQYADIEQDEVTVLMSDEASVSAAPQLWETGQTVAGTEHRALMTGREALHFVLERDRAVPEYILRELSAPAARTPYVPEGLHYVLVFASGDPLLAAIPIKP